MTHDFSWTAAYTERWGKMIVSALCFLGAWLDAWLASRNTAGSWVARRESYRAIYMYLAGIVFMCWGLMLLVDKLRGKS